MNHKLEQLISLFEQLEAWDTNPKWIEKQGSLFGDFISRRNPKSSETHFERDMAQYYASEKGIKSLVENCEDEAILQYLTQCLDHPNKYVRSGAFKALGLTRNTKAISALVDKMQHDIDLENRVNAAHALEIMRSSLATAPLMEIISGELENADEAELWWTCANALSAIGDPSSVDALIEALARDYGMFEHEASDIRKSINWALVSIGGEEVIDKLITLWARPQIHPRDYQDEDIRSDIIHDLGQIHHSKAIDFILAQRHHENSYLRQSVVIALSHWPDDARTMPALIEALADDDSSVRESAERSLQNLGNNPRSI